MNFGALKGKRGT